MPALSENNQAFTEHSIKANGLQCLFVPASHSVLFLLRRLVVTFDVAYTDEQDICCPELYALLRSTRLEFRHLDRISSPGVVRQRVSGRDIEIDQVEEHTATANSMVCPI